VREEPTFIISALTTTDTERDMRAAGLADATGATARTGRAARATRPVVEARDIELERAILTSGSAAKDLKPIIIELMNRCSQRD
jgi:hypothetical protein